MRINISSYRSKWQELVKRAKALKNTSTFYAMDDFQNREALWQDEAEQTIEEFSNQQHDSETDLNAIRNRLSNVAIVSFVGASGTGKSTRATYLAEKIGVKYFIDDGLLISDGRIVAGTSAKKAKTKFESIRQAIFSDEIQAQNMRRALAQHQPTSLMILGTSNGMIYKICEKLWLNRPSMVINIEDITTVEERRLAKHIRESAGQHIIPVPSMEVKHEFNGYFSDALDEIQRRLTSNGNIMPPPLHNERTVVRPTFSSLGKYSISDEALASICILICKDIEGLADLLNFKLTKDEGGISLELGLALLYGFNAQKVLKETQAAISNGIEKLTAINVHQVSTRALRLHFPKKEISSDNS